MHVIQISISGVVQGVGFRPHVYLIAQQFAITGWVSNNPNGVFIKAYGDQLALDYFIKAITEQAPPLAKIHELNILSAKPCSPAHKPSQFTIQESQHEGKKAVLVPTDFHVCESCLAELGSPTDRRYRYPFINCTHCGPRYSLIRNLPYDRASTTMSKFSLCESCLAEYQNPLDRRYHAQPNACANCGPTLQLLSPKGEPINGDEAIYQTIHWLRAGKIIAIKSTGGFHLAVNAKDNNAIATLRQRKRREAKPFAVMVANCQVANQYVTYSDQEANLLNSAARPIVLLKKKPSDLPDGIAPRNPYLGVMLASMPLHYLLFDDDAIDILVMTSGNISGNPMVFENDVALSQLFQVADFILLHNRDIETRVDDSVIKLTTHSELTNPIMSFIRKSRGYAPYTLRMQQPLANILALGAELKTTIALSNDQRIIVSQHIGDLKNDDIFNAHQRCIAHLAQLYALEPEWVACDMHPNFHAPQYAHQLQKPIIPVQHHHAHMAACMGENNLSGPTIGVIFDGAGYGLDGTLWGGEFLVGDYVSFTRSAHLRPIPLIGADKAVHEPIRIALALILECYPQGSFDFGALKSLRSLSPDTIDIFTTMYNKKINTFDASSIGRLFDGVAALLNIATQAEYEAQGPIELEGLLAGDLTLAREIYPFHLIGAVDIAYKTTQRAATCSRHPEFSYKTQTHYILQDQAGSREQVAARRNMNCQQTLDNVYNQTVPLGFSMPCQDPLVIDYRPMIITLVNDILKKQPTTTISRRFHSSVVQMIVQVCHQIRKNNTDLTQVVLSGGVFLNSFLLTNSMIQLTQAGFKPYCHHLIPTNDAGISPGQILVADAQIRKKIFSSID